MCGIVGYVGSREATPVLLDGLKRLEYRGYDSAGIAIVRDGALVWEKTAGKIHQLEEKLKGTDLSGTLGIAHTRWATHGEPNRTNAHPHFDCAQRIALIHNGIIENYQTLKKSLEAENHRFVSETDTETLVHLIEKYYTGKDLEVAVRKALEKVEGTYGILVISATEPGKMVAARNGSPIVMGIGEDEYIVASDVAAILKHTRQVIYLEDHEMIVATPDHFTTMTIENEYVNHDVHEVDWDLEMIEKGGHAHFMFKEIFEQPETIKNAMRGRLIPATGDVRLGGLNMSEDDLRGVKRIVLLGCGTSWHAGLIGEYMVEEKARIPVEVEYASEFRYRNPIIEGGTIVFAISQSGETVDTLAALREAEKRGARCLGICNVVGSTIARESHSGVYIHAGPEIGVASTKAFTSQITVLSLLALVFGRLTTSSSSEGQKIIQALMHVPDQVADILKGHEDIRRIAEKYYHHNNFLYLGRGANYPVALEGALKLKELAYMHAEGFAAGELKHGPIALIEPGVPVIVVVPSPQGRGVLHEKIISNIQEVRARGAVTIVIAEEGDDVVGVGRDHVVALLGDHDGDRTARPDLLDVGDDLLVQHAAPVG